MMVAGTKKQVAEYKVIRRNWGYQDGLLMAELGKPYIYTHFDKDYLAGWQEGHSDWKAKARA